MFISGYNEARGHEIERKPYLHSLHETAKDPVFGLKATTENSLEEPGSSKRYGRGGGGGGGVSWLNFE